MTTFRSKPSVPKPKPSAMEALMDGGSITPKSLWDTFKRAPATGKVHDWFSVMGSGYSGMAGRHTFPSTPEYPFGTVLKHKPHVHDSLKTTCDCRLMAGLGPEQGVLLSWPADRDKQGETSYYFHSEWEPDV